MSKKDFGTVADWVKVAVTLVGVLGALASYQFLPEKYNWVWPLLAVIGLVGIVLIVLRLPKAKTASAASTKPQTNVKGDRNVVVGRDFKGRDINTGDRK